jgi:hypothetical protein
VTSFLESFPVQNWVNVVFLDNAPSSRVPWRTPRHGQIAALKESRYYFDWSRRKELLRHRHWSWKKVSHIHQCTENSEEIYTGKML